MTTQQPNLGNIYDTQAQWEKVTVSQLKRLVNVQEVSPTEVSVNQWCSSWMTAMQRSDDP